MKWLKYCCDIKVIKCNHIIYISYLSLWHSIETMAELLPSPKHYSTIAAHNYIIKHTYSGTTLQGSHAWPGLWKGPYSVSSLTNHDFSGFQLICFIITIYSVMLGAQAYNQKLQKSVPSWRAKVSNIQWILSYLNTFVPKKPAIEFCTELLYIHLWTLTQLL